MKKIFLITGLVLSSYISTAQTTSKIDDKQKEITLPNHFFTLESGVGLDLYTASSSAAKTSIFLPKPPISLSYNRFYNRGLGFKLVAIQGQRKQYSNEQYSREVFFRPEIMFSLARNIPLLNNKKERKGNWFYQLNFGLTTTLVLSQNQTPSGGENYINTYSKIIPAYGNLGLVGEFNFIYQPNGARIGMLLGVKGVADIPNTSFSINNSNIDRYSRFGSLFVTFGFTFK